MLKKREDFEKELKIVLSILNGNKRIKNKITERFVQKGFLPGEIKDIFAGRIIIDSLSQIFLCLLSIYIYEISDDDFIKNKIQPTNFFTELEIEKANEYTISQETEPQYPIIFKNIYKINSDQWMTTLTAQELVNLFNRRVITYNPETQRQLKIKEYKDKIITEISINKQSVKEIKEAILTNKFVSNFITFNIEQTGQEVFYFDEKANTLTIENGTLSSLDGFHRDMAIIEAVKENPEIEYITGVMVTNFDIPKAQRYIVQEDKKNKISSKHIKSLNVDKPSNLIVKKINENSNSYLSGKVTTNKLIIKKKQALVLFDVLSDVIDIEFNPKENKDVITYSKFIIDGLNYIIENNTNILEEILDDRIWIYYIMSLKDVYLQDNWKELLNTKINNINLESILRIPYNAINKSLINRIRKEVA